MGIKKKVLIGLLVLMAAINLIAVFSPELGFDALWYHLTLTKLFLLQHRWFYPGGLLYYSAMPRLGETIFIPMLAVFGTTGPKLVQFIAGVISAWLTYRLARLFLSENKSLLAVVLFYCTGLVSWQSGSAYVDLIRTMFETGAVYLLVKNELLKNNKNILFAGILFGLAIGTKWHALGSLVFAMILFNPLVVIPTLFVASPWFIIATHYTGHPLYPLNEPFMKKAQFDQVSNDFLYPFQILKRWVLLPFEIAKPIDDLLNPLLGLLVPLGGVVAWYRQENPIKKLVLYGLGGLFIWQLTPPPSSRYLLPYLPVLAVLSVYALQIKLTRKLVSLLILLSIGIIVSARFYANLKYVPYLLRQQTQNQFLANNAFRLPGTFIDSDGWVEHNVPKGTKVLVDSLHNLYYLPVNFDHATWKDPDYKYQYLITTGQATNSGVLEHTNSLGIQVFKL